MLTAANQPVRAVVTAAGVADSQDSQILILIADFHACRRVVITAGKIQAKDGKTG
jgi:hypothetical protein